MGFEDSELVGKALAGKSAAFEELVNRYRDAVCGVAYHYIGNFEDVQDAAQESFVQAYLRLGQLRDPAKFGPWLRKITSNVCMGMLNHRSRCRVGLNEADEPAAEVSEDERRAAVRAIVTEALGRLSDKVRLTVTLTYINGYSHDEVASFLEIPVNTVRSRLQHAKKQLREEMIAMVGDVLHEEKPDSELTERIMDAMRKVSSQSFSERLRSANETLELVESEGARDPSALKKAVLEAVERSDAFTPDHKQQLLKMTKSMTPEQLRDSMRVELLLTKIGHVRGDEMRATADEVMCLVERIGEAAFPPRGFLGLAQMLDSVSRHDDAQSYYMKALEASQSAGDTALEGEIRMWLGARHMREHEPKKAREHFTRARDLLPPRDPQRPDCWKEACDSVLALLDEVGDEAAARLIGYNAPCGAIEESDGAISFMEQPMMGVGRRIEDAPALNFGCVFLQVSLAGKTITRSAKPGDTWSGRFTSWTFAPLETIALVKSKQESVSVPAGTFDNCLLMEYVTKETLPPDDAPEEATTVETRRSRFCGWRLAWFAPGVGLVQLQAKMDDGTEAVMQLREYEIEGPTEDCFPLAVGNRWSYGWADIPEDYVAKESYRITANEGDAWIVEHYQYIYKTPPCATGSG